MIGFVETSSRDRRRAGAMWKVNDIAYIDLDEINRLDPNLTAKYPLSFANGISAAINEINRLPNADVVPKSEVEKLKDEIDRLKYNLKAVLEERSETKQEVVDEFISLMIDSFGVNPYDRMNFDVRDLAELKKKYEVGNDG